MTKSLLACLALSLLAVPALANPNKKSRGEKKDTPPAKDDGKGTLKPGQAVGPRKCLGSANNVNVDASSTQTFGIAHCQLALKKVFTEDKHMCDGKPKGTKIEYSWQFGEGEYATTGKHYFNC